MDLTRMMLQIRARPLKFPHGQKRDAPLLPCYFNAGEISLAAVSPDPVSTDVKVTAADL